MLRRAPRPQPRSQGGFPLPLLRGCVRAAGSGADAAGAPSFFDPLSPSVDSIQRDCGITHAESPPARSGGAMATRTSFRPRPVDTARQLTIVRDEAELDSTDGLDPAQQQAGAAGPANDAPLKAEVRWWEDGRSAGFLLRSRSSPPTAQEGAGRQPRACTLRMPAAIQKHLRQPRRKNQSARHLERRGGGWRCTNVACSGRGNGGRGLSGRGHDKAQ